MYNITSIVREDRNSYIVTGDRTIIDVTHSFASMTGYSVEDFLGKDITEVFKMLRIGPNINLEEFDIEAEYFLFSKSLEVKFVHIEMYQRSQETVYVFSEIPNSNLEDKLGFVYELCSDNYYGIGIYSMPDMTLIKANQKFVDFKDEPYNNMESCIGKHVSEFVTGFNGSTYEKILSNIIKTGKTYNIDEYMYERLNRGITYWKLSLVPIHNNKKLKYCVVMATEITEQIFARKQLEDQAKIIKQQKQELEAIINNMSDSVMVFDKDGKYIIKNKASIGEMEAEHYESVGDSYKKGLYFDLEGNELGIKDLPAFRVLNGEQITEQIICVKMAEGDRYIGISGAPIYDEHGEFLMGIVCIRDITESESQNRIIKQQIELVKATIENMNDSIVIYDNNGNSIFKNTEACRMNSSVEKGASAEHVHDGLEFFDLDNNIIPKEKLPTRRVLKGERVRNEMIVIKSPNKVRVVEANASPVFDSNNNLISAVITHHDVTQMLENKKKLKEQNEELLRAEREKNEALVKAMEMKDEFLSIISHEFRTPLNVITTAIQAMNLLCKDEMSGRAKEYIKMIKQNAFRQLRLVNNLLDITRANSGSIKINYKNIDIVYLTKAITESVNEYASGKGVNVSFTSTVKKKIIGIDDEKYERIMLNLISNAIKFSIKGKYVLVKLHTAKNKVCVEVIDEGIGIPEDKLDLIFERFGQVDSSLSRYAEGSGIGLSLVKKLIEALGGTISVKSKVGKGSTFTIVLPSEKFIEEGDDSDKPMIELMDNRLVEVTSVEFSDIYL